MNRNRTYLRWYATLLAVVLAAWVAPARAADTEGLEQALRGLVTDDPDKAVESAAKIGALADPRAIPALDALCDDRLKKSGDGKLYIDDSKEKRVVDAVSGETANPGPLETVDMNNALRRAVLPILAQLKLRSPDERVRLAAAEELGKRGSQAAEPVLREALAQEKSTKVKEAIELVLAKADLHTGDRQKRLAALVTLKALGDADMKSDLAAIADAAADTPDGADRELRNAAKGALTSIEGRERLISLFGDLVHGISLASVLLFAALGLAVTFGLMGVINMAHGEMLMLGAYTTYTVQVFFEKRAPAYFELYPLVAVPLAFLVAMAVGMFLERIVIRHLYGRQLETLLATWGVSLVIIQAIRLIYGAQNVAVANPHWLAGGTEIARGLVLPYSRIAVVVFVIVVSAGVWVLLQRTSLGIKVRAVTQNRAMAACLGVPTKRVDMLIFGLGCGIAGLGGVALSQLGNVGPELGQSYIIDSFMVVVLGGVGRVAGTLAAALGLGVLNKLLEPFAGAVLGKIAVLMLIILFIQRRPEGLFAVKGRVDA
ncbi:MAG TPA: urea ABC transporter permease subunit UrtB [Polyangiaceae bacterium]|nr:urea ABC transporter permease subunit UrtB [Polyangiaceae bacterium]